jgi:hypothetical protein
MLKLTKTMLVILLTIKKTIFLLFVELYVRFKIINFKISSYMLCFNYLSFF